MPVVPVTTGAQVAAQPLPQGRFDRYALTPHESAFEGSLMGEPLEGATRVADQLAEEERQKANQIAIVDADGKLSAAETQLLHDPNTGLLNKRGKDAFSAPEDLQTGWQKAISPIADGLTTDTQKLAFQRMAQSRFAMANAQVQEHVAQQRYQYDQDTTQTYLGNEQNAAIQNYADPARVQDSVDRQVAVLKDYASRNPGLPDGWLEHQTTLAQTKTYSGVVQRLLANGQDLTAKAYYDQHKDQISGEETVQLDRAVEEGSVRGESQRQSDQITATAKTLGDALAATKEIQDPRVRDATEDRVRRFYAEQKQNIQEQQFQNFTNAGNIVEQTHDSKQVPPSMWMNLSLEQRDALDRRAEQLQKGIEPTTNWQTYYNLKSLASSPDGKQNFLQTNMMQYRDQLSNSDFKDLVDLQVGLRKQDTNTETKLKGFETSQEIVNGALKSAGINPNPKPDKDPNSDAAQVANFRRDVQAGVDQIEQTTGKPAKPDDVQRIVDQLMVRGVVAGSGVFGHWQTTKPVFQSKPGETLIVKPSDIPPLDLRQIRAALIQHGQPVTDQAIIDLYNKKVSGMVQR